MLHIGRGIDNADNSGKTSLPGQEKCQIYVFTCQPDTYQPLNGMVCPMPHVK